MTWPLRSLLAVASLSLLLGATPVEPRSFTYYMAGQPNRVTEARFHAAVAVASAARELELGSLLAKTYKGSAQTLPLVSWGYTLVRVPESSGNPDLNTVLQQGGFSTAVAFSGHFSDGSESWPTVVLPELRVRFKDASSVPGQLAALGAQSIGVKWQRGGQDVMLTAKSSEQALRVAAELFEAQLCEFSYPNLLMRLTKTMVPNDTYYGEEWHLQNIGATGAWELDEGANTVTIAVIDDGTDTAHADLAGNIVAGLDVIGNGSTTDSDPRPAGDDAHGTATAGLAAGVGNNNRGIAGVCQHCKIMPIRIMDSSAYSSAGTEEDAFYFARTHGAHILSNSWGPMPPIDANYFPDGLKAEIHNAVSENKVVLFAAGNEANPLTCPGGVPWEPAAYQEVIAVGATDAFDDLMSYSNYGNDGCPLTLVAPAASFSTDITGTRGYNSSGFGNDYTDSFGGTSAACPVTAGSVGVLLSIDPQLTWGQVVSVLKTTADKVGSDTYVENYNHHYGYGRLNLYRAATYVDSGTLCEPAAGGEAYGTAACSDGVDNDCDSLVDAGDPSCAPSDVAVGSACTDSCGSQGKFCLEQLPDGYCSDYCDNNSCNAGAVCWGCDCDTGPGKQANCACDPDDCACDTSAACNPESAGSSTACACDPDCNLCMDSCLADNECRTGYVCAYLTQTTKACYPDCAHDGFVCNDGDTCNPLSGWCEHDGPNAIGSACATDLECSDNGLCIGSNAYPDADWPEGYCSPECSDTGSCAAGAACVHFTDINLCFDQCAGIGECRTGYGCWSGLVQTGRVCFPSCAEGECADTEVCCAATGACELATACPAETCSCDTGTDCQLGCNCDVDCCTCDTTGACEANCACDADCCSCDSTGACDSNCTCDPDCGTTCSCNTTATCQAGCSCDPDCGSTCSCDKDAACDSSCACDGDCPCGCDKTTECDGSCKCDPECLDNSSGCGCQSQTRPDLLGVFFGLLLLVVKSGRRARR